MEYILSNEIILCASLLLTKSKMGGGKKSIIL